MTNKRFAGQVLRILGLAIEMLGILAAALSSRQEDAGPASGAGLTFRQICVVVGVGFVVWVVGTALTYWPGSGTRARKPARLGKNDLEL